MKTIKQLLVLLLVNHQVHLGHGGVSRFLYEVKINKQPNPESGKRRKIKLIFLLEFHLQEMTKDIFMRLTITCQRIDVLTHVLSCILNVMIPSMMHLFVMMIFKHKLEKQKVKD